MTTGTGGPPLLILLTRMRDTILSGLHDRLAEEGFDGVRSVHGSVFRTIDPEGSRLTTLAERAGLTKQAMAELVMDLEKRGYVERLADTTDRRAKIIRLTETGRDAQAAASRILGDTERRWAALIGDEQFAALKATLAKAIEIEAASG